MQGFLEAVVERRVDGWAMLVCGKARETLGSEGIGVGVKDRKCRESQWAYRTIDKAKMEKG